MSKEIDDVMDKRELELLRSALRTLREIPIEYAYTPNGMCDNPLWYDSDDLHYRRKEV